MADILHKQEDGSVSINPQRTYVDFNTEFDAFSMSVENFEAMIERYQALKTS